MNDQPEAIRKSGDDASSRVSSRHGLSLGESDAERGPIVTIAIPFLGSRSYLREAVESVIAQECPQWRLVVCEDDRGEEGIDAMLAAYNDARITHRRDTARLDIAGIFNCCLESADTELVTLLHHDDRLRPNYVASMLAAAERHPQAIAFFCRAKVIDARGRPCWGPRDLAKRLLEPRFPRGERVMQGRSAAVALLRANFIVGPSMCFRRSRLSTRRFDPRWKQVLDFALNMQLLFEDETLVGLSGAAYEYRRHRQQSTAENLKRLTFFTEQATLFDELAQQAQRRGWVDVVKTARAKRIINLDLACQAAGDILRLQWRAAAARIQLLRHIARKRSTPHTDRISSP